MPAQQEHDLRQYINILVRRQRIVISLMLLTILGATLITLIVPPPYQATANVAIIKAKSDVNLDSRLKTITDESLAAAGASGALNETARRTALIGLVPNGAIATQVITRLGNLLSPAERDPATLINMVQAETVKDGDLIALHVTNADPVKAADIANAWANEYEHYINTLYSGAPTAYSSAVSSELGKSVQTLHNAQADLEAAILSNSADELDRQIQEKKTIIDLLQKGKSTAVSTIIDEELSSQQQIISAYYSAQAADKLLAFNKQQEAKRTMLSAYIDAEIQNRLLAFQRDRDLRTRAFSESVQAELENKQAVFSEQVADKRQKLSNYYAQKTSLERLLDNARSMRNQVNQGGNAAAATNALALLLLKSQAFSPSDALPGNLQLQVGGPVATSATQQLADIDAMITALTQRRDEVNANIQTLSKELLAGTGYNFLDQLDTTPLTITGTNTLTSTGALSTTLSASIAQKYRELFDVGDQAKAAQNIAINTPIFSEIKRLYPDLFSVDQMMELADSIPVNNPLFVAATERSKALLNLKQLESLPEFSTSAAPLVQQIEKLQGDIRKLQVQKEQQQTNLQSHTQVRDIAAQAYSTLLQKQTEVGISAAVTGSEVRFAGPAVPPIDRSISRKLIVLVALVLGLLLGIAGAFIADLFLSDRVPQALWGNPAYFWNRAYHWMMTPGPGLPPRDSGTEQVYSN